MKAGGERRWFQWFPKQVHRRRRKNERTNHRIFHLARAAWTSKVISSRAFFFALSVMPSSDSSSSGVVNSGSNSRIKPSFVGTLINAESFDDGAGSTDCNDEDDPELEWAAREGERDRVFVSSAPICDASFRMTMLCCRFRPGIGFGRSGEPSSSSIVSGTPSWRRCDGNARGLPLMLNNLSFLRGKRG